MSMSQTQTTTTTTIPLTDKNDTAVVVVATTGVDDTIANTTPEGRKGVRYRLNTAKNKLLPGIHASFIVATVFYFIIFVIGCMKVNKCPLNSNIPLYLIVAGVIGITTKTLTVVKAYFAVIEKFVKKVEASLYLVEVVFFILGSYWVYSEYKPNYDPEKPLYCDKTAYLVAFWFISIIYIILLILIFVCCCICGVSLCLMSGDVVEVKAATTAESQPLKEYTDKTTK